MGVFVCCVGVCALCVCVCVFYAYMPACVVCYVYVGGGDGTNKFDSCCKSLHVVKLLLCRVLKLR